jgi:hypothetical protein
LVLSKQLVDSSPQMRVEPKTPWFTVSGTSPEWTPEPRPLQQLSGPVADRCEPTDTPPVSVLWSIGDGIFFTFTIRRVEGGSLGLQVEPSANEDGLAVRGISPGGAIEAWNRQCYGSPCQHKAVQPGDKIACVNGVSECAEMLEEVKTKQLLKLLVVRGGFQ